MRDYLGGSFSLGYKLSSSVAEPKIAKLETQVATLREHFRGLELKERFLALYVRYLLAKENRAHVDTPENQETLHDTKEAFGNYIFNLWQRHEEAEEDFEIKGLVVGKGARPTEATGKFLYDDTIWPIPPELKPVVLEK